MRILLFLWSITSMLTPQTSGAEIPAAQSGRCRLALIRAALLNYEENVHKEIIRRSRFPGYGVSKAAIHLALEGAANGNRLWDAYISAQLRESPADEKLINKIRTLTDQIVQLRNISVRMWRRESFEEMKERGFVSNLAYTEKAVPRSPRSFGPNSSPYEMGQSAKTMRFFAELLFVPAIRRRSPEKWDSMTLATLVPKHSSLHFKKLPAGVRDEMQEPPFFLGHYLYEVALDRVTGASLVSVDDAWIAFDRYFKLHQGWGAYERQHDELPPDDDPSELLFRSHFSIFGDLDWIKIRVFEALKRSDGAEIRWKHQALWNWEVLIFGLLRAEEIRLIKKI